MIELTGPEISVLQEAQANVTRLEQQASLAQRQCLMAMGAFQQALRTILVLRGLNPDGYQLQVTPEGEMKIIPLQASQSTDPGVKEDSGGV